MWAQKKLGTGVRISKAVYWLGAQPQVHAAH